MNLYGFVQNQPTNLVDPDGNSPDLQDIGNAIVGFGDSFYIPILIRDWMGTQGAVDKCSAYYQWGKTGGFVWGMAPIGLRSAAWLGGTTTRVGHWLNHGRYWRIGPNRMPSNGGLPFGTHVPRFRVGSEPPTPGFDWRHWDLRSRLPFLPPIGGVGCGCE